MMTPEDYGLVVTGLILASSKGLLTDENNISWQLVLLDLMSSGTAVSTLAAKIGLQLNSLNRLLKNPKAQPSFSNGCRILAFYAKVQKSTKI